MPFNGAGLFSRVYQWVNDEVLGLNVDATRTDTDSNDIAAGLSNCVTRDGQSPWLANLPAGGMKISGLGVGTAASDSVNYGQVFNNPSFVTPSATTSPLVGDNSLHLATTAFVVQQAFSAALPSQPGGPTPYVLSTLNGVASFAGNIMPRSARTANAQLVMLDSGQYIDITSGTFTQTLAAASTLLPGWFVLVKNSGTGDITLDPDGADTIDGLASFIMYAGECRAIFSDGAALFSTVITPFSKTYIAAGNFVRPPGYRFFSGLGWSGGQGGGRDNNAAGNLRGSFGGGCFPFNFPAASIAASEVVLVGAGGAAVTTTGLGGAGGSTSFGSLFVINGGDGGGGNGGSVQVVGTTGFGTAATQETGFAGGIGIATEATSTIYGGAAPATNAVVISPAGSSVYGGSASGNLNAANVALPGTSKFGGTAGAGSSAGSGAAGGVRGGAGGPTHTGATSGPGGRGELQIWGVA